MVFINKLVEEAKQQNYNSDEIEEIVIGVMNKVLSYGVKFKDENTQNMFINHLFSLAKRVLDKKLVDEMELDCLDQISIESFVITDEALKDVFEKYHLEQNRTERFLVATHIEMNKSEGE